MMTYIYGTHCVWGMTKPWVNFITQGWVLLSGNRCSDKETLQIREEKGQFRKVGEHLEEA